MPFDQCRANLRERDIDILTTAHAVGGVTPRPVQIHQAWMRCAAGLVPRTQGGEVDGASGRQLRADHQGKAASEAHAASSLLVEGRGALALSAMISGFESFASSKS